MFGGGLKMLPHILKAPQIFVTSLEASMSNYRTRTRSKPFLARQLPSMILKYGNLSENMNPNHLHSQTNTVGIIGGVSVITTLVFLEKLVWWSTRDGQDCIPFILCNDPAICQNPRVHLNEGVLVKNLRRKRDFLEKSGAQCTVMPCYKSQARFVEAFEGCSVPFLSVGDCVVKELTEAKLRPLEAGSNVRIGLLGSDEILKTCFYQKTLQSQGFEVVLPDKATMEHIVIPAIEAITKKDKEGARTLLRIAIHVLLVRAVNYVILAFDEFHGLLPGGDPLLKKCIDPMDALARSTVKWAKTTEIIHM